MKNDLPAESPLVLVVDDDPNMRLLTRAALEPVGFKVAEAEDGASALLSFEATRPEIVLIDVVMPVMDGYEACRALRRLPNGDRVPIVVLTSLGDFESIERAYEAGATDFITKPINWSILSHRMRYMVRASRAANELRDLRVMLELKIEQLNQEIANRVLVELELKKYRDHLEELVKERTAKLEREITVRRQTEEKLIAAKESAESANRTISGFLSNMSHELNTPLNAIIGFTQLTLEGGIGELNRTQQEYLGEVLESGRHLLSLIGQILDLTRLESRETMLDLSNVHFNDVLMDSMAMVKQKAAEYGIEMTMDIEPLPEVIVSDEQLLRQVLFNLFCNAIKFTPKDGKVNLSARCFIDEGAHIEPVSAPALLASRVDGSSFIHISISDTGIGIEPQDLTRIFNPFVQCDVSLSRRFQGSGLGLSLTKKLVELLGGTIWAESGGKGKGSTFHFTLPFNAHTQSLPAMRVGSSLPKGEVL